MADLEQICKHEYIIAAMNDHLITWNGSATFNVWEPTTIEGSSFRQWRSIDCFVQVIQNAAEAKIAALEYFEEWVASDSDRVATERAAMDAVYGNLGRR